jgi:hypothetical protein
MNRFKNQSCLTAVFLAAAISLPALAQDASAPKKEEKPAGVRPDETAMMATMMELAKPGENHKLLEGMVGSWTYKVKYWMSPDPSTPPMESSGTTLTKSAMGGRYFISEHKGNMQMPGADGKLMDMPFNGMAVEGFDNVKKKFVSSWIDNMGTGIMQSEGVYDPAARTLTYSSEYEPMPGMKTKVREVIKIVDQDNHTMEFFEDRRGGEVKTMEITYTRAGKPKLRSSGAPVSKTAD